MADTSLVQDEETFSTQNSEFIERMIEENLGELEGVHGTQNKRGPNSNSSSPNLRASRSASIIAALLNNTVIAVTPSHGAIPEENDDNGSAGLLEDEADSVAMAMLRESSVGIDEEAGLFPRPPSPDSPLSPEAKTRNPSEQDDLKRRRSTISKSGVLQVGVPQGDTATIIQVGEEQKVEQRLVTDRRSIQLAEGVPKSPRSRDRPDGHADDVMQAPPSDVPEDLLRDNEKYAIFFRMLRMGVPMPAVKNKMVQKGCNPNILDLGEEATMSRVMVLERAYEADLRQAKAPKKKGETIHWEAIPEARLTNKETVFEGPDFTLDKTTLAHISDLLELFKKLPVDPEKQETNEKQTMMQAMAAKLKKERVESVLDGRRAQAISIAMKKLKILPDQPAKFTWALREMNENVINSQAVEVLMACPLWPVNDEELHALKTKAESGARLAEPDKLILFVVETVPDVVTRINALAFRWEFEESIMEAVKAAGDVKVASKTVLAHSNLKVIIRAAIMVGNAINEESGVQIKGCTLSSLVKLATTKTIRDKSSSVLDCVAGYCMRCYPEFINLSDLIPIVVAAKKIELETQVTSVRDMRRGVEAIRKMRQLEVFAFEAMRRLDIVESEMGVARDFYDHVLEYFGLQKSDMDTNLFYELLFQFIEQWNKAIAKKQKEVKTAAAAMMAAAAAKKAEEKAAQKALEKAEKEKQRHEEADANKGKMRFNVQLMGLFNRKAALGSPELPSRRLETRGSNLSVHISGGGSVIGDGEPSRLSPAGGTRRRIRKSIFRRDGAPPASPTGSVRAKGRRSIFWG